MINFILGLFFFYPSPPPKSILFIGLSISKAPTDCPKALDKVLSPVTTPSTLLAVLLPHAKNTGSV
jgi:hypothetical protein